MKFEPPDVSQNEKEVFEEKQHEIKRIDDIFSNKVRRAELGCVLKTDALDLLEEEYVERVRVPDVYGIVSYIAEVYKVTTSKCFQIE